MGNDCGPEDMKYGESCTALYLNDKLLFAEHHLSITRAFPSNTNPQLVSIETNTGGNACCDAEYILDFTRKPPLTIKDYSFDESVSSTKSGIVFTGSDQDALGDQLKTTYSYKFGSGRVEKLRETPLYTTIAVNNGRAVFVHGLLGEDRSQDEVLPSDVLADPVMREPILRIIGKDGFSTFRQSFYLPDPVKLIDGAFVVGSGCKPHACADQYAMFILDVVNKLAWAIERPDSDTGENPTVRVWGVLTPKDVVPMREMKRWLAEKDIPVGQVSFVSRPAPSPSASNQLNVPTDLSPLPDSPQATINLQKEGGTFVVPVTINGAVTLKFTIDSGASDVSIPADVVMTLVRTGTLTDEDFLGRKTYRLADGSKLPSQQFVIHSLKIGDHVVENVTGSIAPVEGDPLLGQSFLSRFRSWSIDNQKGALTLN